MEIKQAVISFWYKELEFNPICKVGELENSLASYFEEPFLINEKEPLVNINLPRIIAQKGDENLRFIFNMTLVSANLNISFNNVSKDEIILKINEMTQIIYDVLKEIYNVSVVYSSIKIEFFERIEETLTVQKELFKISNEDLEDFMVKFSLKKDDKYYLNEITTVTKEVKVDIKLPKNVKPIEGDMVARSMLISLKDSKVVGNVKNTILEINDRLTYNNNPDYLVNKDSLRDLLFEFKILVDKYIKE